METSRSMKRRRWKECGNNLGKEKEREGETGGEAGIRRIAFCLCSIKGEITHLRRFFLKTTALIDQTTWMYQPIFNMKYRHQKSITPVFSLPSALRGSPSLLRTKVDASTSLSARLSMWLCLSSSEAMDLPLFLSDMYIMLSAGTSAWQMGKSIIFNNYLTFLLLLYLRCFLWRGSIGTQAGGYRYSS